MKKKLLILATDQFGYLTDTLRYCQYARQHFDITYVGWDYGRPKVTVEGVKVHYVSRDGNLASRNYRLLQTFHRMIARQFDLVFVKYVRGISAVKLLNPKTNFVLDIRTLCVDYGQLHRLANNALLYLESRLFKKVTVISPGVAERLGLRNYHLLPIGGEPFCKESRNFNKLHLLYVGTLDNRNILDCVKGFHSFLTEDRMQSGDFQFTIVGDSPNGELDELANYINRHGLEKYIHLTGAIPNNQLARYFEAANVGISYIPITPYYDHQTPTKTLEYLVSGLPVIATATSENAKILRPESGVLIRDNAVEFLKGLHQILRNLRNYNSASIQETYQEYTWKNIVDHYFVDYLSLLTK